MMPKIIHQIWIGPNPIPSQCINYIKSVKELHQDYSHILWTNNNLPALPPLAKEQFERYGKVKKYAFQADILRYFLLYKFGGIYLDIDFEIKKKIEPLLSKNLTIVGPPYNINNKGIHWIANSFFAANRGNLILCDILQTLKNEIYHGPIFFASKIKNFLQLPADKTTCTKDIQEACVNNDFINFVDSHIFFKEYAAHHALKSWL